MFRKSSVTIALLPAFLFAISIHTPAARAASSPQTPQARAIVNPSALAIHPHHKGCQRHP